LDERWAFLGKKYSYERRTGHFREMKPEQLSEFLDDLYHHYVQMEGYVNQLKLALTEIDRITSEN
jgi:cell division septum initiation protein DivIVA